jgi:hypothetical protein
VGTAVQRFVNEDHAILTESRSYNRKKAAAAALLLAVAAGAVVYATEGNGFNWRVFAETVSGLDTGWLALSIVAAYSTYVVRALRWAVLIEPLRPHPRFGKLLSATIIGFSAVTALGRPAEMVRPYLIASREDLPFSSQVAAWVVERIYDCLFALAVFGFAVGQVSGSGIHTGVALSWTLRVAGAAIGFGAALGLGLLLAMKYRSDHIQRWILRMLGFLAKHHFEKAERLVEGFLDGIRSTKSQTATARLILYTSMEWVLVAACYACVLKAFGDVVEPTPVGIAIILGFVSFGSLVQLPAVGGGAQVTAVLVLTQIFGVPLEVATGIGLMLWFISFVSILPVGVALAVREGLTWAGLRQAELTAAERRAT